MNISKEGALFITELAFSLTNNPSPYDISIKGAEGHRKTSYLDLYILTFRNLLFKVSKNDQYLLPYLFFLKEKIAILLIGF